MKTAKWVMKKLTALALAASLSLTGAAFAAPVRHAQAAEAVTVKKGTVKTINGIRYKTTSTNTVAVVGVKNRGITKLSIPAAVRIGGKRYKVTEIGANAFSGCSKLEKVVLGKYIKSIGRKAFAGTKELSRIKILSKLLKKGEVERALEKSEIWGLVVPRSVLKKYKAFLTKEHLKAKYDLLLDSYDDDDDDDDD